MCAASWDMGRKQAVKQPDGLSRILSRLKAGDRSDELKREVQEFLVHVDPKDLYIVEQQLIAAGLSVDDLVHRCSANIGMARDEMKRMKATLPPDHLMYSMVTDHASILDLLDELERMNEAIQDLDDASFENGTVTRLIEISERMLALQPHHECEEHAVYPEMERRGELGPPQAMRLEHEEVNRRVADLMAVARAARSMNLAELKRRLDPAVKFVLYINRDHVFKEIYILYPAALRAIDDPETWERMKNECSEAGYCPPMVFK